MPNQTDRAVAWNDAEDQALRALWDEGHPSAEIARRMGRSNNSIVGRAHRLRLPARPSPIVPALAARRVPRNALKNGATAVAAAWRRMGQPRAVPGALPIPTQAGDPTAAVPRGHCSGRLSARGVSSHAGTGRPDAGAALPPAAVLPSRPEVFFGLRGCRWPLWADDARPDHTFCGVRIERGAYCAAHGARAYTMRAADAGPVPPMGGTVGWQGKT